jgi:uncharacterized protein involved in tellurium resistance
MESREEMSLTLLVVMVVAGITAIVVAVHMTGGTTTAALNDEEAARRRFADDFGDIGVDRVWLTESRNAAVLELDDGRAGVVSALGDRFLTRIVSAGDPAIGAEADGRTVSLNIDDFTWRGGPFIFAHEREAAAVARLFNAKPALAEGVEANG